MTRLSWTAPTPAADSAATLIAFRSASDSATPQRSTMPLETVTFSSPVWAPRFFLQAGEDAIADRLVRRSNVEQLACAGHRLKKIGPAHDTDQLTVLQNGQSSDGVLLHQGGDFMERRLGRGRDDIPRHDIRNLAAVGFDIFGRQCVALDQCSKPPGAVPFGACLHAVQQIAFADNADELAFAVQHGDRADLLFEKQLRNLLHGGGGAHGDDRGNHDVTDKHGTSPINGTIIRNPRRGACR